MSEWSSTNVTHPDESKIQRGKKKKKKVSPLPLSLSHTLTRTNPKPLPESLWSEREKKKSINASVGLPWLEHGTVSLLSGCVNLFCLVCCESVLRLKHSSMPACFIIFYIFFPLILTPSDFALHSRFDVSHICQWRGLEPTQDGI